MSLYVISFFLLLRVVLHAWMENVTAKKLYQIGDSEIWWVLCLSNMLKLQRIIMFNIDMLAILCEDKWV